MTETLKYRHYRTEADPSRTYWWIYTLRGLCSLIFGGVALIMPIDTILALTILFGTFCILDGIFTLVSSIQRAYLGNNWGWFALSALSSILIGILVLIAPHFASLGFSIFQWVLISSWAIGTGLFEINAAILPWRKKRVEFLLALSGFLSVFIGISMLILLWSNPMASLMTLGYLIGINALLSGILLLVLAYLLFKRSRKDYSY
jgi:uncharacterized membrane protein HdeD (DUF308 family)